ncbi:glycosyltransferase family 4 protein [Leptolyngbya sp. FACHB-17]|uniref:MraY family glycosyltransferase n=1 Tax=unclassified Leptolyngbya TaxID=2650499 RepID=UPI00168062E5|nr:glycosyltransferase family 4 protein [Leptolyngbya sp. FACHB-17]MBD2080235.1 glycosyltransferase family 4 protein [Leptolyngbya sp. FACHB-17]
MNISFSLLLASGGLSFLLVASIKQYFSRFLLDIPNDRSSHTQPTPRGGGLGFVVAFAITSAAIAYFNWQTVGRDVLSIWAALIPLVVVGLFDDRGDVPARIRYLVQLSSAGIAIAAFSAFPQPWLTQFGMIGIAVAIVLTMIGMTALINFYNFMDGLDGLVASVSAVQLSYLAIALNQPLLFLLVVALLGFLWWNWSPAKIFMGDVGSTTLGAMVAIALLHQSDDPVRAWSSLAITLPLTADAIYTLIRRLLRHENIFKPHRTHLYQRLQQSGWNHAQVATAYVLVTIAIALNLYFLHEVGAMLSGVEVICAIALLERYLSHQQGVRMRTVIYSSVRNLITGLRAS